MVMRDCEYCLISLPKAAIKDINLTITTGAYEIRRIIQANMKSGKRDVDKDGALDAWNSHVLSQQPHGSNLVSYKSYRDFAFRYATHHSYMHTNCIFRRLC